jgi:hemoglobin-like flavoprotein
MKIATTGIDTTLERAAEHLGDLTPHVMALYLQRHPEAAALFNDLGLGEGSQLEGRMVEAVVYFLMEWQHSPAAVRIALLDTLPHHVRTLGIPIPAFRGLVTAVFDTVRTTIPAADPHELEAWEHLHQSLLAPLHAGNT